MLEEWPGTEWVLFLSYVTLSGNILEWIKGDTETDILSVIICHDSFFNKVQSFYKLQRFSMHKNTILKVL